MQSKTGNNKTLVIGSRGGIGSALISQIKDCDTLNSAQLDLDKPEKIDSQDFSNYDYIYNATGHSKGTYLGFQKNSFKNIISQINVNFVSNILLLKKYAEQRNDGTYVWISSDVSDHPRPFHSVYASSKVASRYAFDLIKKEITHIDVVEVKIGLTRTNFRYNNFLGTKTHEQVDKSYDDGRALEPKFIAEQIVQAVNNRQESVHIK
jgi:NADP-dependent 3-hydroxy acid dehydrogenase YdfG